MVTTALDFSFDISTLGSYIGDALGSLGSIWVIPAGLIIGSAILLFLFKLLAHMKDKINCEGEREERQKGFKERANRIFNRDRMAQARDRAERREAKSAFLQFKKGKYRAQERQAYGDLEVYMKPTGIPKSMINEYEQNYTGDLNLHQYYGMRQNMNKTWQEIHAENKRRGEGTY